MYIVKGYCFEDSKIPNLVVPYKTKKGAENRKEKAIKSKCFHRVEIIEEETFKFI